MPQKKITAADLFCGAGGSSSGLAHAVESMGHRLDLLAINHWSLAIATHKANHPEARHLCVNLDTVDPRKVVPGGHLDILIASPECQHHSRARGSKPMSDQSRASAWIVLRWVEALRVDRVLIENIPEFVDWSPLGKDGRPLKSMKGKTYLAFLDALRSLGYRVEWRILNTANYGDATTRKRVFIMARRGNRKIHWPDPSHVQDPKVELFKGVKRWRAAKEVIDWRIPGHSIFQRKRPLAPTTVARIAAGLKRFCGPYADPFLVMLYGTGKARSIHRPLPTVTAKGQHIGLVKPFFMRYSDAPGKRRDIVKPWILPLNHGRGDLRTHSIEKPMPTVTSVDAWAIVQPFLIQYYGQSGEAGVHGPLPTVTTKDRFGLIEPAARTKGKKRRKGNQFDIFFRMLQPQELAAAMSFDKAYSFSGSRSDTVRQIGNAVPVRTARALCRSLLAS